MFEYLYPTTHDVIFTFETCRDVKAEGHRFKEWLQSRKMYYKAAAGWMAAALKNEGNFTRTRNGAIRYNADFYPIIRDSSGNILIEAQKYITSDGVATALVAEELCQSRKEFAQLHYVAQAMLNAMNEAYRVRRD